MSSRTKKALCLVVTGIAMNLALALAKLFIGLRSNSLCILLDSTNGFFDVLTGIVTAVAFGLVALAPTEKFPYGFGRSEYLAGFVVAIVAAIMGVTFLLDSLNRIAMPEPVWFGLQATILLIVGIVLKLAFALAVVFCNRSLRSKALKAVAVDSFLDVGITSATLLSFTLSAKVSFAVDSLFGIVISVVVLGVSVKMIVDSIRVLVGSGDFPEEKAALLALCKAEPLVDEINLVCLHDYGYRSTAGTVALTFSARATDTEKKDVSRRLSRSLKEQTGASIRVVSYDPTLDSSQQ